MKIVVHFLSSYAQKLLTSLDVINFEQLGHTIKPRALSDIYIDALLNEVESANTDSIFSFDKKPISGELLCKQKHSLVVINL